MKLAPALVLALGLAVPTVASADACHVAAYLPGWVGWVISAELPGHDVVALEPASYVYTDKPVIPTGQATLVRASRIIGQTVFTDDPAAGVSSFVVNDATGKKLFELRLDVSVCRLPGHAAGLCRTVTARTALEPTLPAAGGEPLQMQLGPDATELPLYYRYGTVVDFAAFHQAFADMVNWLEATLVRTSVATPDLSTPQSAAYWALVSLQMTTYLGGLLDPVIAVQRHPRWRSSTRCRRRSWWTRSARRSLTQATLRLRSS